MNKEFLKRVLTSVVLLPLSYLIIVKGSYLFAIFLSICLMVTCFEWYKMTLSKKYSLFGFIFIFFSFFCTYNLRNMDDENNLYLFLFIILICISTDIGGYIFGKLFKGPKLTKISPNKTYSGMLGGFVLSTLILTIFIKNTFFINLQEQEITLFTYFIIILISSVSQIGDLTVSYFKRISNIKNTGNLIPGHGGILDRIDGMIFAFPFYYIIYIFN